MNSRRTTWWCWGAFDALLLADYLLKVISTGRVPFLSDLLRLPAIMSDHGLSTALLMALRTGFLLSLVVSCVLFFAQHASVKWLVALQLPLRLLFFIPSISLLYLYAGFSASANPTRALLTVLACELLKIGTLWFFSKKQAAA
ncbi:hypothetical protein JYG34_23575 [Pseudomonas entomophila]|uniref:hypothetical protein n=1 Tax=Pseudomonas entomophila TaxID=312306 RepID=UPI001BCAB5D4|nr:hypothetical protein [Pseudomonas entomophila]QVM90947.1 hypothetical protein JYG34_23575 [Pseudomonas entomophila]